MRTKAVKSLEKVYEDWLIYRRDFTSAKHKTIYENTMDWNKFIRGIEIAKTPINELTPVMLTRFFRSVTKDRNISHKRISNVRSVLNGIMAYAIEEEMIIHNPVSDVNFQQFVYKPVKNQMDNVFTQ